MGISEATKEELQAIADTEIEKITTDLHNVLGAYYNDNVEKFGTTVTLLMVGRAINGMSLGFYGGLEELHEKVLKKYERDNG